MSATTEDMLIDIWAHRYAEDPKLLAEVEDDDFDPDMVASLIGAAEEPQQETDPADWEDMPK